MLDDNRNMYARHRRAAGITQEKAAELLGCSVRSISNSGEELYRRAEHPREDSHTQAELEAWDHLEAFDWCVWDEDKDDDEIEGQEVMEDGENTP